MTTTPALARATEALVELDGRLELLYPEHLDDETVSEVSAAIVSAALHDPDGADWLAKAIDPGAFELGLDEWAREEARQAARRVVAAILGEA